jgi:hypothetical protein
MRQAVRSKQWWQAMDRRTFGKGTLAFAALAGMSGCKGEEEVVGDSLALQRQHGWNLGAEQNRLFFRNVSSTDATALEDVGAVYGPNSDASVAIQFVTRANPADFFPLHGAGV